MGKNEAHRDGGNKIRVVWHYGRDRQGREVGAAFLSHTPVPILPVTADNEMDAENVKALGRWDWLADHDPQALFPLGELFLGAGQLNCDSAELEFALFCHSRGEWGDVLDTVRLQNRDALRFRGRLISVHRLKYHAFTIITEADRRRTTVFVSDMN